MYTLEDLNDTKGGGSAAVAEGDDELPDLDGFEGEVKNKGAVAADDVSAQAGEVKGKEPTGGVSQL